MPDLGANEGVPMPVTAEQVHTELEKLLRDHNHMGVRNFLGDVVLDPRNPFQRARRSPRKWVVVVCAISLAGLLLAYWFHFR